MYTVKGYVGSEEKLRTYFAGCAFEKKPRVLFVTDEILSDHITCFEYLDTVVDHIKPHRGDRKLFWDRGNWQPLCEHHHNVKTMTEDRYVEYKF